MAKRPTRLFDFSKEKQAKTEIVQDYKFGSTNDGDFLELVEVGGGDFRSDKFWNNELVKEISSDIFLRPGRNDSTNQMAYVFMKENSSPFPPSIVEIPRKKFPTLKPWLEERIQEIESALPGEAIKILKDCPAHMSPKKIQTEDEYGKSKWVWPADFFENVTLQIEDFRLRPYYNAGLKRNSFFINNKRKSNTNETWQGPIIELTAGALHRALQGMMAFENKF